MSRMPTSSRGALLRLDQLVAHPHNVRDGLGPKDDLQDLARSLREHGILQPLVVTGTTHPDRYLLLAGHRRAAAATLAGLTHVPVTIRSGIEQDSDEHLVLMLVENVMRRDLDAVEKAQALGALRNRGLSNTEIARRTGMHVSTVTYHLQLLDLDDASLAAVDAGEVSLGAAHAAIVLARQQQRATNGTPARGRPTIVEAPYFSHAHPLAAAVRHLCDHSQRPKVGKTGCGQCWEQIIRADALGETALLAERRDRATPPPVPRSGPQPGSVQRDEGVDEAAVERAVAGERMRLTIPEREEAVRRLCGRGLSDGDIADRLGVADRTVFRIRQRLQLPANVDAAGEPTWRAG